MDQKKRAREEEEGGMSVVEEDVTNGRGRQGLRDLPLPELLMQLNTNDEDTLMDVCSKIRERFAGEAGIQLILSEPVSDFFYVFFTLSFSHQQQKKILQNTLEHPVSTCNRVRKPLQHQRNKRKRLTLRSNMRHT